MAEELNAAHLDTTFLAPTVQAVAGHEDVFEARWESRLLGSLCRTRISVELTHTHDWRTLVTAQEAWKALSTRGKLQIENRDARAQRHRLKA